MRPSIEGAGHVYEKKSKQLQVTDAGGGGRHSLQEHSWGWENPWGSAPHPQILKTNGSNPWTAGEVEGYQRAGCPRWVKQASRLSGSSLQILQAVTCPLGAPGCESPPRMDAASLSRTSKQSFQSRFLPFSCPFPFPMSMWV